MALGTYDLQLAEAMAERTHLDPKEYQPCLEDLRSLLIGGAEDLNTRLAYQHARINLLLGRHREALKCLHEAGPVYWEEFCELTKNQGLFAQALDMLEPMTPQFSVGLALRTRTPCFAVNVVTLLPLSKLVGSGQRSW